MPATGELPVDWSSCRTLLASSWSSAALCLRPNPHPPIPTARTMIPTLTPTPILTRTTTRVPTPPKSPVAHIASVAPHLHTVRTGDETILAPHLAATARTPLRLLLAGTIVTATATAMALVVTHHPAVVTTPPIAVTAAPLAAGTTPQTAAGRALLPTPSLLLPAHETTVIAAIGPGRTRRLVAEARTTIGDGTIRARGIMIGIVGGGRCRGIGTAGGGDHLRLVGRMEGLPDKCYLLFMSMLMDVLYARS